MYISVLLLWRNLENWTIFSGHPQAVNFPWEAQLMWLISLRS